MTILSVQRLKKRKKTELTNKFGCISGFVETFDMYLRLGDWKQFEWLFEMIEGHECFRDNSRFFAEGFASVLHIFVN
jgi:hypothetical protein